MFELVGGLVGGVGCCGRCGHVLRKGLPLRCTVNARVARAAERVGDAFLPLAPCFGFSEFIPSLSSLLTARFSVSSLPPFFGIFLSPFYFLFD